jgi:GTP-binding protein EngB required for normal cell division
MMNASLPGNDEIRHFMDQLTSSTHISEYVELPMIAVMGDTSSGKSSLLSQISGIELPSSHQLSTRCPILLQMSKADEKKATVNIQWRHENELRKVFEERIVSDDEWSDLPQVIAESQKHILSHSGKEVASDVVHVHVFGPSCHDLTLIDLPGIVRSHGFDESPTLMEDVEHLMETYLNNTRCIILALVPANVDFHNSQILQKAQTVDPETLRTIPVITKPDLIDEGAESDVVGLLMGKKMSFELGFHMCKGRGQAALDRQQPIEEALLEEEQYFDDTEPWKGIDDRSILGTANLRRKLGDLQMQMIRDSIPGILVEIRRRQQKARDTLASMGTLHQTTADKRRYYQDFCQSYMSNLHASLSGKGRSGYRSAAAKLHDECSKFMDAIRNGSLGTIKSIVDGAQVLVTSAKGDVRGEIVHVDDGFACVDYVDEKDRTTDSLFDFVGYVAKEHLEEDDVWSDGSKVYIARKNCSFDLLKNIPLNRIRTDPSWLIEKIADNRTDDLACFLNVEIFKCIVADFVDRDWKPHCDLLVDVTESIILAAVSESLVKTCLDATERFPKLKSMVKQLTEPAAQALLLEAKKQVKSHLEIEKHPYTQDHILFENIAASRHRSIKRELEVSLRLDQAGGVFDTVAIKSIMDGVFERSRRKSVEEHMAEDMEIVLESYGKVATKRVIDRTPMICWEIFRSLSNTIQESMWNITDKELEESLQDTSEFAKSHKDLSDELEEMNKALKLFQLLL